MHVGTCVFIYCIIIITTLDLCHPHRLTYCINTRFETHPTPSPEKIFNPEAQGQDVS